MTLESVNDLEANMNIQTDGPYPDELYIDYVDEDEQEVGVCEPGQEIASRYSFDEINEWIEDYHVSE